jgi:cytoskeleton protein RodZ
MASIGAYLRELRTRRGVSLDELARTTRVAPRYLEALERDGFQDLPAPVFIRGFIRAYCQALGESPSEALACYDGHDGRIPAASLLPAAPPRAGGGESRRRGTIVVSSVLLVILGMALFTVALVIRPGDRGERSVELREEPRPPSPAPAASETTASVPTAASPLPPTGVGAAVSSGPAPVAPTPAPAVSAPPPVPVRSPVSAAPPPPNISPGSSSPAAARPAVPAGATAPQPDAPAPPATRPTAPAAPAAPGPSVDQALRSVSAPYRLVARATEPTWIRVRTEDGRTSEETVPAGEVREWVSDRPFVLSIGNAGGLSLELNGRALPPLGPRGVVVPRFVVPPDPR